MAQPNPLPDAADLEELLEGLTSQPIHVTRTESKGLAADFAGHYVTRENEIAICCVSDVEAASILGAAIAAVPPGAVEEFKALGGPPENVVENFRELVNVCGSLVCNDRSAHVRLAEVVRAPFAADVESFVEAASRRVDYCVEVGGYGTGRVSFMGV